MVKTIYVKKLYSDKEFSKHEGRIFWRKSLQENI